MPDIVDGPIRPRPGSPEGSLVQLAAALDRVQAWVRRTTPPSSYSMTARTTLARLESDGPERISTLARLEGVTQPAMTGLVNRLEAEGIVRRDADPDDGRAAQVSLTAEGRRWITGRRADRARVLADHLARMPATDLDVLLGALPALERLADSTRHVTATT